MSNVKKKRFPDGPQNIVIKEGVRYRAQNPVSSSFPDGPQNIVIKEGVRYRAHAPALRRQGWRLLLEKIRLIFNGRRPQS